MSHGVFNQLIAALYDAKIILNKKAKYHLLDDNGEETKRSEFIKTECQNFIDFCDDNRVFDYYYTRKEQAYNSPYKSLLMEQICKISKKSYAKECVVIYIESIRVNNNLYRGEELIDLIFNCFREDFTNFIKDLNFDSEEKEE